MKEQNLEANDVVVQSKVWGMPRFVLGSILLLVSLGLSAIGQAYSGGVATARSIGIVLALYGVMLALRFGFLWLSGKMLKVASVTWYSTLLVVGANASVMMLLTTGAWLLGLNTLLATVLLFLVTIVLAFFIGCRVYRVPFLEMLALYALSFALLVIVIVTFAILFKTQMVELMFGQSMF